MATRRSKIAIRKSRPRQPHLDQELSYSEAARALGRSHDLQGRKLRAMVQARERETGKRIAIRLGGATQPKSRVTLGILYEKFPELHAARDQRLAQSLRQMVAEVRDRVREIVADELARQVGTRLHDLESRIRQLEASMRRGRG